MASGITFPLSESPQKQVKVPHLPFRRISLPTAPSIAHRESVFSIASVDSLQEGDDELPHNPRMASGGGPVTRSNGETRKSRPMSIESPRRRTRTRESNSRRPDEKLVMKRKKIIDEFYETEVTYVDGLDMIYNHFLTPIITSLETSEPLLDRLALTSIFSNFIDIWNLHKSFLSALTALLKPNTSGIIIHSELSPPNLSSILLAHFPYLSLYTPFITSFPQTISALTELATPPTATRPNPQYNFKFAIFLTTQEADPRCGKLKLRDWLLTIVQRCPRYLLLLQDLINHTEKEDPEHTQLTAVHTLASKITMSLNTSLHTHAQTLALLALQKATPNLPFQLISPGRNLVKRGALIQLDRNDGPIDREFLLFSDCLLWLAPADGSSSSWSWSGSGTSTSGASLSSFNPPTPGSKLRAPPLVRSRSKSDAELSTMRSSERSANISPSTPTSPTKIAYRRSHYHVEPPPPPPNMVKRNPSVDDRWAYKGRVDLVDIEVVVGSALEDERRFEILSPGGSFAVYAASEEGRDEWTSEIRAAKQQLLISLNVMNPNSTLTSSTSTNHVRRALQALPYHPSDERVATMKTSSSVDLLNSSASPLSSRLGKFGVKKDKEKEKKKRGVSVERRRKVEHWVPPVWIPDSKTSSCMRCGRMFGWRRRRHHCRLCGRCVCAACSSRTFFITETTSKEELSSKPARACDACYETVFPLIGPQETKVENRLNEHQRHNSDTITSLSHLPSWLSMPALPVQHQPQALMAISPNSSLDLSSAAADGGEEKERRPRIRVKSHQRLRSYQQIVMDFKEQARAKKQEKDLKGHNEDAVDAEEDADPWDSDVFSSPLRSVPASPMRKENATRKSQRFSLPAVAVHAASVTARTTESVSDTALPAAVPEDKTGAVGTTGGGGEVSSPAARYKRFSLVLGGRNSQYVEDGTVVVSSAGVSNNVSEDGGELGRGVAATKLAELLKKAKSP